MASFAEFDNLEVADIQAIAAQFGGGAGGGVGPKAKAAIKAPPILKSIVAEAEVALRRDQKAEKVLRTTALREGRAAEKALTKENTVRDKALRAKVKKETEIVSDFSKTRQRVGENIKAAAKGALIGALPPTAAQIGFAALEGFRAAGAVGGIAGAAGVAGTFILQEIARRNEEQQEAIRRARGFESLGARKRRLRRATPGIFDLPGAIIDDPVKEAKRIVETAQLFIQENVKAPLAGVKRRFEVTPGLEFAYDATRIALGVINASPAGQIASFFGFQTPSAEDILPSIPIERFHRETDIAKWQSLPTNAHPAAGFIMNEMRRRIDSQIAGTGVAGGWKVEPVSGD